MGDRLQLSDFQLVRACVDGDQLAWKEFYGKYVCLVRSVVRRQSRVAPQDMDDLVQMIFGDLVPALRNHQEPDSLTGLIITISRRVCISEYHRRKAAKRDGQTVAIDDHDSGETGLWTVVSNCESPEEQLAQEELKEIVRQALWDLSEECSKILTLREFDELPWKDIAQELGQKENTVTVKARRCMEDLKALCHTLGVCCETLYIWCGVGYERVA